MWDILGLVILFIIETSSGFQDTGYIGQFVVGELIGLVVVLLLGSRVSLDEKALENDALELFHDGGSLPDVLVQIHGIEG